jgi:hypothetical protein
VVINELMYHPSSENPAEEYIELYNRGTSTVNLAGWQFTNGVSLTFPAGTTMAPGTYLVIAANPTVFHAKYPLVANYLAATGWTGQLSNSSNHIELVDSLGVSADEVEYCDDGDWAERERDNPPSFGHRGWVGAARPMGSANRSSSSMPRSTTTKVKTGGPAPLRKAHRARRTPSSQRISRR